MPANLDLIWNPANPLTPEVPDGQARALYRDDPYTIVTYLYGDAEQQTALVVDDASVWICQFRTTRLKATDTDPVDPVADAAVSWTRVDLPAHDPPLVDVPVITATLDREQTKVFPKKGFWDMQETAVTGITHIGGKFATLDDSSR